MYRRGAVRGRLLVLSRYMAGVASALLVLCVSVCEAYVKRMRSVCEAYVKRMRSVCETCVQRALEWFGALLGMRTD